MEKYLLAETFNNADPQQVLTEVAEFVKDKKDFETVYNTTTVIVGMEKITTIALTNGQQAMKPLFAVITSCLVMWTATKAEADEWNKKRLQQNPKLKIN